MGIVDCDLRLRPFFDEMVYELNKEYPEQIVSIVLFGSATTGEWIRGKSDIDCMVITKNKRLNGQIELYMAQLLLGLDEKHSLNLAETCTSYKRTGNTILNLILKAENKMMFGQPFYVLAEDQLNLKEFKISKDLKTEIGARTVASLGLFLRRIKDTGIIIYGKDIRDEIPKSAPVIEKIKASFNAMLLLMMSFVIFPHSHDLAFSHAVKANFWACNDVLFALGKPLSTTQEEIQEICSVFGNSAIDSNHLMLSLQYKKSNKTLKTNKAFVMLYMLKSTKFVYGLYAVALTKLFRL